MSALRSGQVCHDHQQLAEDCGCAQDSAFCALCETGLIACGPDLLCPFCDFGEPLPALQAEG